MSRVDDVRDLIDTFPFFDPATVAALRLMCDEVERLAEYLGIPEHYEIPGGQ